MIELKALAEYQHEMDAFNTVMQELSVQHARRYALRNRWKTASLIEVV